MWSVLQQTVIWMAGRSTVSEQECVMHDFVPITIELWQRCCVVTSVQFCTEPATQRCCKNANCKLSIYTLYLVLHLFGMFSARLFIVYTCVSSAKFHTTSFILGYAASAQESSVPKMDPILPLHLYLLWKSYMQYT